MRLARTLLVVVVAFPLTVLAAELGGPPAPPFPSVAVTGAATATVANDRMHAVMRAEAEAPTAAAAANEVNGKIAQALARAKAVAGVDARTAGYSTWQTSERGKPPRWRVVQYLQLEGSEFAQLATLVTGLQEEGVLLSGLSFSLRTDTRRRTEDTLTQEAIRTWQQRAAVAASALGFGAWRPGRVTVNTGDGGGRPEPVMRAQAMSAPSAVSPIAVEGGTTDITVSIVGEAILDKPAR